MVAKLLAAVVRLAALVVGEPWLVVGPGQLAVVVQIRLAVGQLAVVQPRVAQPAGTAQQCAELVDTGDYLENQPAVAAAASAVVAPFAAAAATVAVAIVAVAANEVAVVAVAVNLQEIKLVNG